MERIKEKERVEIERKNALESRAQRKERWKNIQSLPVKEKVVEETTTEEEDKSSDNSKEKPTK